MKISITKEEIKAILSAHFGVRVENFDIVESEPLKLVDKIKEAITSPLDKLQKSVNIGKLMILSEKLKQPMIYSDAKWAIDNWPEWIAFVDRYNFIPISGYYNPGRLGQLE